MGFVHEDADFEQLLAIVARDSGIAEALVEKDYWVTHVLWALHETNLQIWFKGGTSLSKGFGLIQRFSEDLDLMILAGEGGDLPEVKNWTSLNKGPVAQRRAFYDELTHALLVPNVRVERDSLRIDQRARGADYLGYYPGLRTSDLSPAMSPFVRLEVGRARVVPCVSQFLSSFVHDYLESADMLAGYTENRPLVRCVHPIITVLEKLDALMRRYRRDPIEADGFVRHYEDIAQIIRSFDELPEIEMSLGDLAMDMLAEKDLGGIPTSNEPALVLDEPDKRRAVEEAYAKIAPMFWGERIPLDEACRIIRDWIAEQDWSPSAS